MLLRVMFSTKWLLKLHVAHLWSLEEDFFNYVRPNKGHHCRCNDVCIYISKLEFLSLDLIMFTKLAQLIKGLF